MMLNALKKCLLLAIVLVSGLGATSLPVSAASVAASASRPYLMGFTRWPPDFTVAGLATMDRFIDEPADLVALQLDNGIPCLWELTGLAKD